MEPNTPFRSLSQRLAQPTSLLSRTPSRRQQFTDHEINPLLSNLSSSSTLKALAATDAVSTETRQHRSFIEKSIASASASERAWGIKAALAGKKLREWYLELSRWSWHGYDPIGSEEEEYWGGLPAQTVLKYEERIEVIRDDMETLEVEDLKNYVRSTHFGLRSRSTAVSSSTMDYDHLDDFTSIITETIVQALPTLSRLNSLINLWTTRLMVVRQVPIFLSDLGDSQNSILSAWTAMRDPDSTTEKRRLDFMRHQFVAIQAILQDQISRLGRRLDTMLDLLEGSKDTLPDRWIDTMDGLENEYSSWAVKAEEVVLQNEIDVEHNKGLDVQSQAKFQSNSEMPQHLEQLTQPLDSAVKVGDVQGNFTREDHTEPPTTAQERVSEKAESSIESHTEEAFPRLDSNTLAHHNWSQETKQTPQNIDTSSGIESSTVPHKPARRPVPLVLDNRKSVADSIASSDMGSDTSYPGSATSDYFSNQSSPEIRSASIVEYVGTPALLTNPWSSKEAVMPLGIVSRRSSLQTERGGPAYFQFGGPDGIDSPSSQRSRASTFVPEPTVDGALGLPDRGHENQAPSRRHVRTRSASLQSFEVIPKHEIRKIMVRRSGSYSPAPSSLQRLATEVKKEPSVPTIAKLEGRGVASSEGVMSFVKSGLQQDEPQILSVQNHGQDVDVPVLRAPNHEDLPIPPKSPHRFQEISDLGPESAPVEIRRKAVAPISKNLPTNSEDRLEARISSILTEIPAHIRLMSGPDRDTSEINDSTPFPKTPTPRLPIMRLNRAQTAITPPIMTLAPAQPKSSKSKSQSGEPEIKLYHLHQSGKDVPVKLFVRLVGEAGERVMVRIGGGWADLAEYLKEYATHHGRRSVSDTRFDIQGLPSSPISQGSSSRPASPISSKPSPVVAFKRQQTTPAQLESPHTPVSDPSGRPSSRMSWTDEDSPSLGLAGPKMKRMEISPRKQAWVDEMLEQARGGSGGAAIGEMGKVGGTKRVFFKGRSRAPSNV